MKSNNKQTWKFTDQEVKMIYVALVTTDPNTYKSWDSIGLRAEESDQILKDLIKRLGCGANHN